MKREHAAWLVRAAMVVAASGGAMTAFGQAPGQPSQRGQPNQPGQAPAATAGAGEASMREGALYRSGRDLASRPVFNKNDEQVGTVSDMILDRGSGRVEYLVVKTGGMLGMGGREVALPYAAFTRDPADASRHVLAVTPEQIKEYPEYSAASWRAMREARPDAGSALATRLASDASSPTDPYAGSLGEAKAGRVEGVVTKVERTRTTTFGEQIVLTVREDSGTLRRVALGPSWYVNLSDAAPMREDRVSLSTMTLARDPADMQVATELRSGERTLRLREKDGSALWSAEGTGGVLKTPQLRYVLFSEVRGMRADCRGVSCGTIEDLIVDRRNGEVGFVSIDPNENFMGINDMKRLIPWSVVSMTEKNVARLDASRKMVIASVETPADVSTLGDGSMATRVYESFETTAPEMEGTPRSGKDADRDRRTDGRTDAQKDATKDARTGGCWEAGGAVLGGMDASTRTIFDGTVVQESEVDLGAGHGKARALTVRPTARQGERREDMVVLIGPAARGAGVVAGGVQCAAKSDVSLEAEQSMIEGRTFWIARSVTCNQVRRVLVRDDNTPAW